MIAYHIRMSFKAGEIGAEKVLELGQELALRWTKGRHQFIVAAHTNTNNPHCHIIYNSVNLDCDGKYQDFKRSGIALRRVSDQICLESGLSIIERPGLSKGHNRAEYLGGGNVNEHERQFMCSSTRSRSEPPTVRDKLRGLIDDTISGCSDFNSFIAAMQTAGCEIKQGKHLAFKMPDGKKFIRCNSLCGDYTETALFEQISGKRIVTPKPKTVEPVVHENRPSLLVDIQAKIQEGKGPAYEQWARVFNIKQVSKTLLFLKENGIDSYDELIEKSNAVSAEYDKRLNEIQANEKRLAEISELQKHIGTYGKTREVYKQYLSSKKREDFFEKHRADITLHKAAKKYFDSLNLKKLPTISSLKQEYAALAAEKKKLYAGYYELRDNHRALLVAKGNASRLLGIHENVSELNIPRTKNLDYSHER